MFDQRGAGGGPTPLMLMDLVWFDPWRKLTEPMEPIATSTSGRRGSNAGWQPPGQVVAGRVADAVVAVGEAVDVAPVFPRLSGGEVAAGLEGVDTLRARMETLTLHLLMEALERGLPGEVGLSAQDWLVLRCPWLAPAAVNDLVTVARGIADPLHAHLREQVLGSVLPVRRAAAVLRALARVKPFLPTTPEPDSTNTTTAEDPDTDTTEDGSVSEYEAAVALLTGVAGDAQFTDRELRRVTDHLTSRVLPGKDHDTKERAARELRGVNESSLADGSLVRFVVTADPEGAALIRSICGSPLAAPCPGGDGARDGRSAAQRRYDALVTVLKRGIAGGESAPTCATATVVITIAWDLLHHTFTGTGTTATGDVVSPATVRKMACDADLIPVVLGTDREILDQGRTRRLVTPGQRRALHHRDGGCTYPGCTIPAPWCDAHHVVHWSHGGRSDLSNYALLCGRHHTLVHARDLTATVHPTSVTWHL
ncbi:MAG: DUF222 domain-containing protein [Ornithinimicrobium sp.]